MNTPKIFGRASLVLPILLLLIIMLFNGCGDADPNALGTPTNVTASSAKNQVTISWQGASNATSYTLYWNTSGNVTNADASITNVTSPHTIPGLTNGTIYHYRVAALNDLGQGNLSSEVSAMPTLSANEILKITAPVPGQSDLFGWSVAINGDFLIAGAPFEDQIAPNDDAGAAYIFQRTALNTWGNGVQILPQISEAGARFGSAVAIKGNYAIVGAPFGDISGVDSGTVYIFHFNGTSWDTGTQITATDAEAGDQFGTSVSIDGNFAIIGAQNEDTTFNDDAGAAYIFQLTSAPNNWGEVAKFRAATAQVGANFGNSVAISGDYAIVGAPFENETGVGVNTGSAYIFHNTGPNAWTDSIRIIPSDSEAGAQFGNAVSIDGDYAVIGSQNKDTTIIDTGAAYVFHRTGTNIWDDESRISASDAEADDLFGSSVSINGDTAFIGAPSESQGSLLTGAAYIFYRTGTNTWDRSTKITASDTHGDQEFGSSVSISGDDVVVGAQFDNASALDAGAAYIF